MKEDVWFLNFLEAFFYIFFWFDVNLHHRIMYSFVLCILHFWFWLVIVFFYHFFFIIISFFFQGWSMESLHSPLCLANHNEGKKNISDRKRGMILLMLESLWERNDEFLCGVWMRHFKLKMRECFCHSFWCPLQTPADVARSTGNKEVADMIDNFQV